MEWSVVKSLRVAEDSGTHALWHMLSSCRASVSPRTCPWCTQHPHGLILLGKIHCGRQTKWPPLGRDSRGSAYGSPEHSLKTTAWTQKLLLVQCSSLFLSFKKKIQARKHSYSVDIKGFPKTQLWEKEACAPCTPHIQRAVCPPMKHLTKTCSAPSLGRQAPLLK